MKLQSVRIKTNDFPKEQKQLADMLGGILNPFIDKLVIGFNKNFTVDDNLPFEFKSIDLIVDLNGYPSVFASTGVVKNQTLTLQTELTDFKGFICLNVTDLSNTGIPSYPTTTPFVIFSVTGKNITINKIIGLTALKSYRLMLLGIS